MIAWDLTTSTCVNFKMLISLPKALLVCIPAAVASSIALLYWYKTRERKYRPAGHVSGLYIYPIKSCKGIPLDSALCLRQGLHLDRRWIILNEKGNFMSQRETPSLTLVTPHIEADMKTLCVNAPGMETLRLTLPLESEETRNIDVFGLVGEGQCAGDKAAAWFSKFLNRPSCKLFYMTKPRYLATSESWGTEMRQDDTAGFGDFSPLLVVTMETLIALNKELDSPVSIRRFRPNIIISGVPACAEDEWTLLKIGDVYIRKLLACGRCTMTTVDPDKGAKTGKEPLATLRRTRMPASRDKRYGNSPFFGIHAIADSEGDIRVGDPVLAK